jgi:hypothetical protein
VAINSVLSTDSITVFGPPDSVTVSLDIGATGERGSFIYSGNGDPNINTSPFVNDPAKVGDLYLRTDVNGNYGTVYQYAAVPGGNEWQAVLKFQPTTYSDIVNASFSSGSANITVALNDFYENAPVNLSVNNLAVQLTAENNIPLVLSVSQKTLTSGASRNLIITAVGSEYDGSAWLSMSGSVNIGINISVI